MLDKFGAQVLPGAVLDRRSCCYAHGVSLVVVTDEIDDARAEVGHIARLVKPSSARRVNEVDGTALARANDWEATGLGLLDSLAEGLEFARRAKHIHAGDGTGEVLPAETAGENSMRKLLFHLGASRAISDDDELGVGDVSEVGHIGDPFLGS